MAQAPANPPDSTELAKYLYLFYSGF
jgi:hypothetical protein